jgi:hypothetical protein
VKKARIKKKFILSLELNTLQTLLQYSKIVGDDESAAIIQKQIRDKQIDKILKSSTS